jgi:hydrogenase maturation factor
LATDGLINFGQYKTDPTIRFFAMEHMSVMVLAWVLVHIGRATVKRADNDAAKHKKMLTFFGIALVLILVSIPWPFRVVGKPYFQWFS